MSKGVPVKSKIVASRHDAIAGLESGHSLLVGGWGGIGVPQRLILAAVQTAARNLTIVSNNCGMGQAGDVGELFRAGMVGKAIVTFPTSPKAVEFRKRYDANEVEVEVVPQGTLAERLRAAGAGIGGFFTPTGAGTPLAEGRETRVIEGREQLFETALRGDFAFIRVHQADAMGNARFRLAGRGFNPLMAGAAKVTVVEADEIVPVGSIAPDDVHLSGVFVDRVLGPEEIGSVEEGVE